MPIIHLPDPVACRVLDFAGGQVLFKIRDAAHADALAALLAKACREGYAVELSLIHYDGEPDAARGRAVRKKKKERDESRKSTPGI